MKSTTLAILPSLLGALAQHDSDTSTAVSNIMSAASATASATGSSNPPGYTEFPGKPNIVSVLSNQPELTMLVNLLGQDRFSDLVDNLKDFVSFTFLAPSNDALTAYLNTTAGMMFQNNDTFAQDVLYYHVLNGGPLPSDDIPSGGILSSKWRPTLDITPGADISDGNSGQYVGAVKNDDGAFFIGGFLLNSTVTKADLQFDQGYVHVIDKVLTTPGTLNDTLIAGNFQALVGALELSNIPSQTALAGNGSQFTLFAPANQAFLDIGAAVNTLVPENLTAILNYHVHPSGAVFADQLKDGMKISTLNGSDLHIHIYGNENNKTIFVNGARVVAPNIVTDQGVIHGIDEVLNPKVNALALASPGGDPTEGVRQFPGATSSVASLPLTSGQPLPTSTIALPPAYTSLEVVNAAPIATSGPFVGMLIAGAAVVAAL